MNQEILITRETEQLVVEGQPSEFVHSEQSVEVFEALSQGPPGPPGPPGPQGPPGPLQELATDLVTAYQLSI